MTGLPYAVDMLSRFNTIWLHDAWWADRVLISSDSWWNGTLTALMHHM